MRFVKPIDEALLHQVFSKFNKVITVEDGVIQGGFGSAVLEFMAENGYHAKLVRLGVPDQFVEHGTTEELQRDCGFDQKGIVQACVELLIA
jgi:1-deoxy-D-xylulose-5-phosphate synthase